MEQTNLNNCPLPVKHISKASDEIVSYIKDRRSGRIKSLKTRWAKFNKLCMGGIEPNIIMTIAGISGSGKSSFVNSLETDLFDLNPDIPMVVLSFSFEMISAKQVGRKLSSKMDKTVSELYNGVPGTKLSEEDVARVEKLAEGVKKYEVYYVDEPGSVDQIGETIKYFQDVIAKDKWLVVILDHTLLVRGQGSETERTTLVALQKVFIRARKIGRTSIIQLSQLNREIEDKDRIANPTTQFPTRRDVSSSDAVYQASDYVIVIHVPEHLGLKVYGPRMWPTQDRVFMHIIN